MVKIRTLSGVPGALAITIFLTFPALAQQAATFDPFEATIPQIEAALSAKQITCHQLVQYYLTRMDALDIAGPKLNSVRMRNPNALAIADAYDAQPASTARGPLFCIPVLVKDNYDTADMPTTAGSVALANTTPLTDSTAVAKLKAAGAIIIAKGNMSEFANYWSAVYPAGYSSLGGYVLNPYDPRPIPQPLPNSDGQPALTPSGSSSGPGVAASANLAAATLGTETSGSILSPSNANSVVGIKPTLGLTSRHGVIPIGASQDTVGPLVRSVTDAAIMLGVVSGVDPLDPFTVSQEGVIPAGYDFTQNLKTNALQGARLGIPQEYWGAINAEQNSVGQAALAVLKAQGATLVNCSITTYATLNAFTADTVLPYEFHRDLNTYLASRGPAFPLKTIDDLINWYNAHPNISLKYGQGKALAAQALNLFSAEPQYIADRSNDLQLSKVNGIDATMALNNLDALIFPGSSSASIAAKAGYPTVIVPAGYLSTSAAYSIGFTAGAYSEPKLIGFAYAYEQASKMRQPPQSALRILPVSASVNPQQVVNYASGASGAIAPGETVAITGTGLGPATAVAGATMANSQIARVAGTTRALFNGLPAPIISAQSSQIVCIVPYGLAGWNGMSSAQLTVEYNGSVSNPMTVAVTNTAPGIFTTQPAGQGAPAVYNADNTLNSSTNPAKIGSNITFTVTGEGIYTTLPIDGRTNASPAQVPVLPVVVEVGGVPATVVSAASTPKTAGQITVVAQLASTTLSGLNPLWVEVGGALSPMVMIYVH